MLNWQKGEFDQATGELQEGDCRLLPDYAEAHYTLGTVFKQQGKLAESAAELREAIRLQPDFAPEHIRRWRGCCASWVIRRARPNRPRRERTFAKSTNDRQAATFAQTRGSRLGTAMWKVRSRSFRSAINSAPDYAVASGWICFAQSGQKDDAKEFRKSC